MRLEVPADLLRRIHAHGEAHYPEEGAGVLLGTVEGDRRRVHDLVPVANRFEPGSRHNRYRIEPQDLLQAEQQAEAAGLEVIGIFHSHPDHPAEPSEFDRQWALPWYSYLITRVAAGKAVESRSWRLADDRSHFDEETLVVTAAGEQEEAA